MSELLEFFKDRTDDMINLLMQVVNFETPSHDPALVNKLVDFLEEYFSTVGADSVTRYPQDEVGDFLLAKWNENVPGKPILFLGHMDTVWAEGTLVERPVRIDNEGRIYGPGAVDMKGGIVVALNAIAGLKERGELPNRPVWFLATSDEEIGSRKSKETIENCAKDAALVIVMEPGTSDGSTKIQRKGSGTYRITVEGKAAHAGNEPEEGINAIVELAAQVTKLHKMNDLRNGTSVSVTLIEGGTAGNVIPAKASVHVDTRVLTVRAGEDLNEAITSLTPTMPGANVIVEYLGGRGPMEYNDLMKETFSKYQAIGKKYGVTIRGESVGGGSDGNFTAIMGIPTIDGMGPYGGGLHALHEHVLISSMAERATVVAGILKDWEE